jgi:hypothetical protein
LGKVLAHVAAKGGAWQKVMSPMFGVVRCVEVCEIRQKRPRETSSKDAVTDYAA